MIHSDVEVSKDFYCLIPEFSLPWFTSLQLPAGTSIVPFTPLTCHNSSTSVLLNLILAASIGSNEGFSTPTSLIIIPL